MLSKQNIGTMYIWFGVIEDLAGIYYNFFVLVPVFEIFTHPGFVLVPDNLVLFVP